MTPVARSAVAAVIAAAVLLMVFHWQSQRVQATAGFWYAEGALSLPAEDERRLGGPLTDAEITTIQHVSRAELARAFAGLRIRFTEKRDALWRIEVRQDLDAPERIRYGSPSGAAESIVLGALGGRGTVSFVSLAQYAVSLAPPRASRGEIVEAIARGIGRAAAHEFAHQIVVGSRHNPADENSYEYPYAARASQYYGELHWTTARAGLVRRLGP